MVQPSSLALSIKVKPMTVQYFHSQLHTQEKCLHMPTKDHKTMLGERSQVWRSSCYTVPFI